MTPRGRRGRPRVCRVWLAAVLIALSSVLVGALAVYFGGVPAEIVPPPEPPVYVAGVFGGNVVGQSFRASHDDLCGVGLWIRPVLGGCQLAFRLWPEGREHEALGGSFSCHGDEGAWHVVRFPRISSSKDVDFLWEADLADSSAGPVVSLGAVAGGSRPDGTLLINDLATASDAAFVPYYCNAGVVRPLVDKWLEKNGVVIRLYLLLALAAVMAWTLVLLLALPSREEPVSAQLPPLAALTVALCAAGAVLVLGAVAQAWVPAATLLQPVAETSPGLPEGPWVVYDFVANLSAADTLVDAPEEWYVAPGWAAVPQDPRPGLRAHAPSLVYYTVDIPAGAWLHAAAALDPQVWQPDRGDGVLFIVRTIVDGIEETIYYQEIDPKNHAEDRRWHDFDVDLSRYAGQTVTLLFITYPLETNEWDQAVWGMPVLLTSYPTEP